jgi:hypothetical protein
MKGATAQNSALAQNLALVFLDSALIQFVQLFSPLGLALIPFGSALLPLGLALVPLDKGGKFLLASALQKLGG